MTIYQESNGEASYQVAHPSCAPATLPAPSVLHEPANHFDAVDSRCVGPNPFDSIAAKKW